MWDKDGHQDVNSTNCPNNETRDECLLLTFKPLPRKDMHTVTFTCIAVGSRSRKSSSMTVQIEGVD